ncbi:MAG TPA: hypothetical protein VN947_08900 [Polyangia bacterium]|nr:hypothetical protein [Polyangia bacterium]
MRSSILALVLLLTCVGCRSTGVGADSPADMDPTGGDLAGAGLGCLELGTVVSLGGDVENAHKLLPGRWLACAYTTPYNLGAYALPVGFAGLEFVEDDSVTQAPAGGGHWFFLVNAADGSIVRDSDVDGGGIFLYNPLPGPDFEQIALEETGKSSDVDAAFRDGPRQLHLDDGAGFEGAFAPF